MIKLSIAQVTFYVPDDTEDAQVETIFQPMEDEIRDGLEALGRRIKEKYPVISDFEVDV